MQPIKVLAVDDEPDIESLLAQSFRQHIRSGEFNLEFAYDGLQAPERVTNVLDFDVILLDINMPAMDGLTFLARLPEQGSDLRVVMVSAYGDTSNIRTSMNRGAYDFITKPVDMKDLEATIRKTAAEVRRYRELRDQKNTAERCRRNLSRYFSPKMAEFLSLQNEPLGPVRRQDVAVLFADLVGFTEIAENSPPETVIDLLRGFHSRMSAVIFAHGGTVEKYIGDALYAAFGVPDSTDADAVGCVACAVNMHSELERSNEERIRAGDVALQMGIGINHGPAVLGDIGSDHSMSFAVIGHTVNVASRLQAMPRKVETAILISDSIACALRESSKPGAQALLNELSETCELALRGNRKEAKVWYSRSRFPLIVRDMARDQ
jgi:adenylate cyclase